MDAVVQDFERRVEEICIHVDKSVSPAESMLFKQAAPQVGWGARYGYVDLGGTIEAVLHVLDERARAYSQNIPQDACGEGNVNG